MNINKNKDISHFPDWLEDDWIRTCARLNKNSINAKILRGEVPYPSEEEEEEK